MDPIVLLIGILLIFSSYFGAKLIIDFMMLLISGS